MDYLLLTLAISVGINLLLFVPAFIYKTDKLTDFSYALSFAVVGTTAFLLSTKAVAHTLVTVFVLIWAARLGSFLVLRIRRQGRDKRFDDIRDKFWHFLRFWLAQAISVWLILLPALLLLQESSPTLTAAAWIGITIFIVGLLLEAIADLQKLQFNSRASGKWIDTGVWRISRHPNYLGEIMVWLGIYFYCALLLPTNQAVLAAASPLFIASLLIFVSGIPILEKGADKRCGKNASYNTYKKAVPVLIPTPTSVLRLFK